MKRLCIAIILLLFGMTSVASAENYTIRAEHNTNLRAAGSLSARIVTTARSGDLLDVIGQDGRWLKISRNGRELWMAAWVDHTRVSSAAADVPADVDNCCFIDRECKSDQEWVSGYWAFQKNQCPVTNQRTATAAQPASAPAQIDNCCFVDRQCHSDNDWVRGYWAYQRQQCLLPGQFGNTHGVLVIGGQGFIEQMEDSLETLKRAPHWYNYTVSGLDKIVQRLESDVPGVHVDERTFYLDYTDHYPRGYDPWTHISNTAAMLSHEACHVHRYEQGLESGGYPGEKACLTLQIQVLKEIGAPASWIAYYENTLANIDNPEYQWWLPGNY